MRFHFRILFLFAFWAEHVSVAAVLYQAVFLRLCRFCQPFSARRCPAEISVADVLFQVLSADCCFCLESKKSFLYVHIARTRCSFTNSILLTFNI